MRSLAGYATAALTLRQSHAGGPAIAKPTHADIARRAGVGTATVERVLNGRGGVKPETVERVLAAARALDYPKRLPEAHRGLLRIEAILVRPETTFFSRLSQAFARIAGTLEASVALHRTFVNEGDPAAIAKRILSPQTRRAGLILAVPDDPLIRAASTKVHANGLPIVQIVTQISGLDAPYVGIDNYAAGRMAGMLIARMQSRSGRVVAFCHSAIYRGHRDRIRGFSDYLANQARSDLHFAQVYFGHDDGDRSHELALEALDASPDLVGLYNAGGANSTIAAALRQHPRAKHVLFVGHELTERSAAALREGVMAATLDQAPEAQAQRAIEIMLARLGLNQLPIDNPPIRFITVTAENI
jgi:LacI family transcriptional regulator